MYACVHVRLCVCVCACVCICVCVKQGPVVIEVGLGECGVCYCVPIPTSPLEKGGLSRLSSNVANFGHGQRSGSCASPGV